MKFAKNIPLFLNICLMFIGISCSEEDSATPAELVVGSSALNFSEDDDELELIISNNGGSVLKWSSVSTEPWLTLSPASGSVNPGAEITVTAKVDKASLSSGYSFADLSILQIGVGNVSEGRVLAKKAIEVSVTVLLPADLEVDQSSFDFGTQNTQAGFTISNIGERDLTWSISSNQSWLTTMPQSGTTGAFGARDVLVNVSRIGLDEGEYNGVLSVTSNGGNVSIAVTMQVTSVPAAKLVYAGEADGDLEIYTMNFDGSSLQNLSNNAVYDSYPRWSPDGSTIVFESERAGGLNLFKMNADGSQVTQLTFGGADYEPSWSPDGSVIIFNRYVASSNGYEIYTIGANGTGLNQLTFNGADNFYPNWSPDGQGIVYAGNMDGDFDIYFMQNSGAESIRLTENLSIDKDPVFSNDGQKIVYASDEDGDYEIYIMNIDGSGKLKLTNNFYSDGHCIFARDSDTILFASDRDGDSEIYSMDINGGSVYKVTNNTTREIRPHQ